MCSWTSRRRERASEMLTGQVRSARGNAMSRRVLLIVNPHARSGRLGAGLIAEQLRSAGLEVLEAFEQKNPLGDLILKHRHEISAVVVGGGDGTVNSAAAALIETGLP